MKASILAALAATTILSGCALSPEHMASSSDRDVCHRYGVFSRNPMFSELSAQYIAEMERRNLLTAHEKELVAGKKVQLGMSQCALYASMGLPSRENRSVGSWGVRIQHVYRNVMDNATRAYVYTENGRVTSWQD